MTDTFLAASTGYARVIAAMLCQHAGTQALLEEALTALVAERRVTARLRAELADAGRAAA